MKVIIAGSRDATLLSYVNDAVKASKFDITEVVSGTARGADQLGEVWADRNNVPVKKFTANWDYWGKAAGYKRNQHMAEYVAPDGGLIAIWDGISKGTRHMINIANRLNLKVYIHIYNQQNLKEF